MSVAVKQIYKNRPFFVSPYHLSEQKVLRPETPTFCIKNLSNNEACCIVLKELRCRKCGPPFPLYVFACEKHLVSFTIYPPGWCPYGRMPLISLAPDGSAFAKDDHNTDAPSLISDAMDAVEGKKWPESARSNLYDKGVFKTQKRYISGLLKLFGIAAKCSDKHREHVTAKLGIALADLQRIHLRIRDGPKLWWREKGAQLKELFTILHPLPRHAASIQILGSEVEFWGQPINCR